MTPVCPKVKNTFWKINPLTDKLYIYTYNMVLEVPFSFMFITSYPVIKYFFPKYFNEIFDLLDLSLKNVKISQIYIQNFVNMR